MKVLERFSCLALAILLFVSLGVGQTTNGSINGTITDPSGSAVGGVQVQVSSKDTGLQRTGTSLDNGTYTVPQLPPGSYNVTIQKVGFASESRIGVELLVNQNATPERNSRF